MRLLLVGAPGSGKGTQAQLLKERLNLTHVGTGDILRQAVQQRTPAGISARPFLESGALVPDAIVNQLVDERFRRADRPQEFVMDGYPRNRDQAVAFDRVTAELSLALDKVIELCVDERPLIERLTGRRICPSCQAVYHIVIQPPTVAESCDNCKEPLQQRKDDNEETIRNRLEVYRNSTSELLEYYREQDKLRIVVAEGTIEDVHHRILEALQS